MHSSLVDTRGSCSSAVTCLPRLPRVSCRSQQVVRSEQTQQAKPLTHRKDDRQQLLQLSAVALAVQQIGCVGAAQAASEGVSGISEATSTLPLALGGGAAIAALSAALLATDPQKRSVAVLLNFVSCKHGQVLCVLQTHSSDCNSWRQ